MTQTSAVWNTLIEALCFWSRTCLLLSSLMTSCCCYINRTLRWIFYAYSWSFNTEIVVFSIINFAYCPLISFFFFLNWYFPIWLTLPWLYQLHSLGLSSFLFSCHNCWVDRSESTTQRLQHTYIYIYFAFLSWLAYVVDSSSFVPSVDVHVLYLSLVFVPQL